MRDTKGRCGWVLALGLALAGSAGAAGVEGQVVRATGAVWVEDAQGTRRDVVSVPHAVRERETVVTGDDGRAAVRLPRSSFVLAPASSLAIKADGWFRQIAGKAMFAFERLFGSEAEYRVETTVATIGVRGTEFLVTVDGQPSVAVNTGRVRVDSTGADFALLKVKEASEFDRFVREHQRGIEQMQQDFERYRSQMQTEFVAYVKGVDLEAQQMLALVGQNATLGPLSGSVADDIRLLRDYAGDVLSQTRGSAPTP